MGLELLVSPGAGAGSHTQPWRRAQNPPYPLSPGCQQAGLTWGQGDRWGRVAVPCVDTSKKCVRPESQLQLILSLSDLARGVIIWSVLEQRRGEWVRNYHPVCLTTAAGLLS